MVDPPSNLALYLVLLLARQVYRLVIPVRNQPDLVTEPVAL
jgi:hypothetical protein